MEDAVDVVAQMPTWRPVPPMNAFGTQRAMLLTFVPANVSVPVKPPSRLPAPPPGEGGVRRAERRRALEQLRLELDEPGEVEEERIVADAGERLAADGVP